MFVNKSDLLQIERIKVATILDRIRLDITPNLNKVTRSKLGQYLTPSSIANFMAGLFTNHGKV